MPTLSVVSPVYNEGECVGELCRRLSVVLNALCDTWEIILVDDGSRDDSWKKIADLSLEDPRVRGIRFSRNFGHHLAITAGLDYSRGDWVVVMDSDLQDKPESIPELYAEALRGFDTVLACRQVRRDSLFKRACSRLFYKVYGFLTDTVHDTSSGVFRIMSRRVVDVFCTMREANRFFPGMVEWVGFSGSRIFVEHAERFAGRTKYPLRRQLLLAFNTVLSFSDKPLLYVMYAGFWMSLLSLSYAAYIVARAVLGKVVVLGYASIASAVFFVGGFTVFAIGLVGIYVGRVFRQVQGRPLYLVGEMSGAGTDGAERARADGQHAGFASGRNL